MIKNLFANIFYYIFIAFCALLFFGGSYAFDFYWRPWAYSTDEKASLFVGIWAGEFRDPDGVSKKVTLEIFTPMTKAERFGRALSCNGKSRGKTRKSFEGKATVTSVLGEENYEIYGYFKDTDFQFFYFHQRIKQALPVANFYLHQTESDCQWQGSNLTLILPFEYQKANGSGFSASDDARFSYKAKVVMKRL